MAAGNVEILRAAYEAFGRGDLDRVLDFFARDVVVRPGLEGLDVRGSYHGHSGVRQFWTEIMGAWESRTVEPVEIVELGHDRILAVERWHVRGRDEIELDFELVDVYTFHEGLIARVNGFPDKARALEDAGLMQE